MEPATDGPLTPDTLAAHLENQRQIAAVETAARLRTIRNTPQWIDIMDKISGLANNPRFLQSLTNGTYATSDLWTGNQTADFFGQNYNIPHTWDQSAVYRENLMLLVAGLLSHLYTVFSRDHYTCEIFGFEASNRLGRVTAVVSRKQPPTGGSDNAAASASAEARV